MRQLEVDCGASGRYPLYVGQGARSSIKESSMKRFSKVFVLTEAVIEEQWLSRCPELIQSAPRVVIPSGEGEKSLRTAEQVWEFLLSHGADRRSLLINIGGGMVTDLGGFAASTYMRGMSFMHMPTTLLSQVDASIGGKTAVNFGKTKNIIGTFTQPVAVYIDCDFLTTLPERDFRAGFAEVLKHGFVRDREYLGKVVEQFGENLAVDARIEGVVVRSWEIKRDIVAADEREGGVRKLLNFGHTFGHAFESLSFKYGEPLLHGEAVAIGMMAEALLSQQLGLISSEDVRIVRDGIAALHLPVKLLTKYPIEEVYLLLERDKKNTGGEISWTLLTAIGAGEVDVNVPREIIESCYREL